MATGVPGSGLAGAGLGVDRGAGGTRRRATGGRRHERRDALDPPGAALGGPERPNGREPLGSRPFGGVAGTECQPVTGRAAFTTDGDGATAALTSDLLPPLPSLSPSLSFLDLESPSLSSFDDLPSLS